MPVDVGDHYNHVTDAWKMFMGEHLHFGYFESEDMELTRATEIMIEKMLDLCDISGDSRILDVGCGIGGPAFYIHEKYKCAIDGISTSQDGVNMANETSGEKGYSDVKFKVADGLDNGFPDNTFDVAWIMETSHLIADKKGLFRECFRVLKDDGTLVLCDLISLLMIPSYLEILNFLLHYKKYTHLVKVFGPAELKRLGIYCDYLMEAGFDEITFFDITKYAKPTMKWWKENSIRHGRNEFNTFSSEDADAFMEGCDILDEFFRKGWFGYGILRALKQEGSHL